MISRSGRLVIGGSVLMALVGATIGIHELIALAAIGAVLVLLALSWVLSRQPRLEVTRKVIPPRVHVGEPSRVELEITNAGTFRTPVATLHDAVEGTRGATLWLGPLGPGTTVKVAYQLPTQRRGRFRIGPLSATVTDPFGLTARARPVADTTHLTVLPHIDRIPAVPHGGGRDPHAGQIRPNLLGLGSEFFSLRPYVRGDDLRRVHWRSSARTDELQVRQDEQPWEGRVTVLADTRRHTTSASSLELVVSAAASLLTTSVNRGDTVRLITTGGYDSAFGGGADHLAALLEELATVEASPAGTLAHALEALAHRDPGTLVAVAAAPSDAELERLIHLDIGGAVIVVLFEKSSWNQVPGEWHPAVDGGRSKVVVPLARALPAGKTRLVRVSATDPFPRAWRRAVAHGFGRQHARVPG